MPDFLTHVFRSWKVWEKGRRSKYIVKPYCPSIFLVHQVIHKQNFAKYIVPPEHSLLNHYRKFRTGKLPVQEREKGSKRILDEGTFVYQQKIVAALNKRLCSLKSNPTGSRKEAVRNKEH